MPILGEPMLFRQIERIRRCRQIDELVVATSTSAADDPLVAFCGERDIKVGRGSENDVLSRFVDVARPYAPHAVVRLTGDCPLADPKVIDAVIALFKSGNCDYASNVEPATFPDGLDVEVIRWSALEQANKDAVLPSHREHVTPFVRTQPSIFPSACHTRSPDLSHLRWTVDEPADFAFARLVYETLYPANPNFTAADVLRLVESDPALGAINSGFERNEGMKKSLRADEDFIVPEKKDA
jgi:spore coat polysaccharide biosynthesis protein SpsF (cytidylyltransferase family)